LRAVVPEAVEAQVEAGDAALGDGLAHGGDALVSEAAACEVELEQAVGAVLKHGVEGIQDAGEVQPRQRDHADVIVLRDSLEQGLNPCIQFPMNKVSKLPICSASS